MAKVVKAIFGNTDFLTAQAFVFEQTKDFGDKKVESIFGGIIEATGEDVFTKVRIAGLDSENIFYDTDEKTSERLSKTLEFIKNELKQTESFSILLFVWHESVLHLLSSNSEILGFSLSKALLFRNGQTVNLTEQVISEQLISGHIQPQDRLLLISGRILEENVLDWDKQFIDKLSKSSIDSLEEDLNLSLNTLDKAEPVAVILISNEQISPNYSQESEDSDLNNNTTTTNLLSRVKQFFIYLVLGLRKILFKILQSKRLLIGGVISLIVLALLVWQAGVFLQRRNRENQEFSNLLTQAKAKIESAKVSSDFSQANILIAQIEKLKPNSPDVQSLKKALETNQSQVLKIETTVDFKEFLSLDLIKKDFSPKRMSYSLGKVLFLDESNKTLISLDLENKTNQILAGNTQLGDAKFASLNGDRAFVYSSDKGVLSVDLVTKKIVTVSKVDLQWGRIVDIFGFSSNIYLIDTLKNQIWKYVPVATGYAEKANYLKDSKVDLAGGRKLQIDYSVWILKLGGEILKFTGGNPDFFSIGGLDKPIEEITSFFVSEEEDNLYLLDSLNSRIIVLQKNGQYQKQIQGDKFKTASDFVVDEKNKKIYILESNKIFQVELK